MYTKIMICKILKPNQGRERKWKCKQIRLQQLRIEIKFSMKV